MNPSDKQELDTTKFLKKLGFKDVNGGRNFIIGGRQVDACGGHEKTLLIVECTNQRDIPSKIDDFRGRIHEIREGFSNDKIYKKYTKYKFVLAIKDQEITQNINERANKGVKIYIWDDKFIDFHKQLESAIKENAKYNLLSELEVKPEKDDPIVVAAFCASVGRKNKYKLLSFFIEADLLMKIAFVARREMGGETFYQRMVVKSRLQQIASDYIDKQSKVFPNSIVAALDDNSWGFEPIGFKDNRGQALEMPNWQEFGKLTIGNTYNSCWIIDGQHRLFSHALSTNKGKLLVSAFVNIDEESQAEYFLDINRKAKRVDPELLWDLLGTIKPNSSEGRVSNVVKELRGMQGFFENSISVPSLGGGKYSFNNICDSLNKVELGEEEIGYKFEKRKNPFWDKDPTRHVRLLAQALNRYYGEIERVMDINIKRIILSDGFISVLIYIYKILIVSIGRSPTADILTSFTNVLCSAFNSLSPEEADDIRRKLTSEGNKGDYRNELVRFLQDKYDPNFGLGLFDYEPSLFERIKALELNFNKFIYMYLEKHLGSSWIDNDEFFSNTVKKNQYKARLKDGYAIWEVMDLNVVINDIVTKGVLWDQHFKNMFKKYGLKTPEQIKAQVAIMMDYRSRDAHKRETVKFIPKEEKDLINLTYKMLSNLINKEIV